MSGPRRPPLAPAALLAIALVPAGVAAQTPDETPRTSPRYLFGLDVAGTFGPRDGDAFFNYTDYEHNALRLARVRLLAEWRATGRVSFLGEVRTEDGDGAEAAAAYVRIRPWPDRALTIQAGRIPPVIGAFPRRAYGRDNALLGTPLAYQYLTSLRPDAVPATVDDLLRMRARGWRPSYPLGTSANGPGVPIVSTSRWGTGIEAEWRVGWVDAAGAWSLGSPAAPEALDRRAGRQWSGRVGAVLPVGLTAGVSGARGRWIDAEVLALVPADRRRHATQSVVALDVEWGEGPWLLRSEWLWSAFDLPLGPDAAGPIQVGTWSGFVEARRRLHARWQLAVRAGRLAFSRVQGTLDEGRRTPWDAGVDRAELAVGFRAGRGVDLRAGWQHNWRARGRVRERGFPAVQALVWF